MPFRSLVFWLGLSVVAFIVWAGVDSATHDTRVELRRGPSETWAVQNAGWLFSVGVAETVEFGSVASYSYGGIGSFSIQRRRPYKPMGEVFPAPASYDRIAANFYNGRFLGIHHGSSVAIPHWLLLLAFLPFWAALFCLRRRYLAARLRRSGVVEDEPAARPVPR